MNDCALGDGRKTNQEVDQKPKGESQYISLDQLSRYLQKGYFVSGSLEKKFQIHPQDDELILKVARQIFRGAEACVIAPFLNSASLAFLVRAVAVATANKPKLVVYSPDEEMRKKYRILSYLGPESKISSVYPLRRNESLNSSIHFQLVSKLQDGTLVENSQPLVIPYEDIGGRIIHCTTMKQLSRNEGRCTLIFDARSSRGWRAYTTSVWKGLQGPKIFLTLMGNHPLLRLVPNLPRTYCRSCGRVSTTWPQEFQDQALRLNNYSQGVSFTAQTIPGNQPALASLELATQRLIENARQIDQVQFQLMQAERLNHFIQDSILPLSNYETAARGLGKFWIYSILSTIKTSFGFEMPAVARGCFRNFIYSAELALRDLSLRHPPKVEWFSRYMLQQAREETLYIYCASTIEEEAIRAYDKNDIVNGRGKIVPITRRELRAGSLSSRIFVPGPPSWEDLGYLVGGISPNVRVLVYPWQARHWNVVSRPLSKLLSHVQPLREKGSTTSGQDADQSFDWETATAPVQTEDDEEAILRKEFAPNAPVRTLTVSTGAGKLEYDEDSLVPTLVADKFVDRPAILLRKGDIIILRSGGNLIDASRTVDALARASPMLSEAATEASVWRVVFAAYIKSQGKGYKDIHRKLFPNNEVVYSTVRDWIKNQTKIGPNNKNMILLLTKIGISEVQAKRMLECVHIYRSYRFKVYRYLYGLWRTYSSRLYKMEDSEEEIEDEKIDPEFGLTLASLENMISFAEVTEDPSFRERLA